MTNPNLAEYAIPIGLALDAAKNDEQSGQFRKENPSKKSVKKRHRQLASYGIACACFTLATLLIGNLALKKQENAFLEALESPKGIRLSKTVEKLEHSLYQEKKSAVNLPTIPRVNEVLTWLSTHPALNEECSITHITYQVTKSPRLGSKIKTYAAKIELELTTPTSAVARTFHDALLKERTMIDQKEGIKWNADHGAYRVSFYLKSRQVG